MQTDMPSHFLLNLPSAATAKNAETWSKRAFQRVLASWAQDLLETERGDQRNSQFPAQKKAA